MAGGSKGSAAASSAGALSAAALLAVEKVPLEPLSEHRKAQRQKQIDLGKATSEYAAYLAAVPRAARSKAHPVVRERVGDSRKRAAAHSCTRTGPMLSLPLTLTHTHTHTATSRPASPRHTDPGQEQ